MPGDDIFCIYEDKSENVWFATYNGVSCYNGKSFTNYTTVQGLVTNTVWSITEDKMGSIYFGTQGGGVSKLSSDKKTMTTFTDTVTRGNVHKVFVDSKGNIWFSIDYGGVTVYDGNTFKNCKEKQGFVDSLGATCIFEDKNNNIWIGGDGISRYDGKSFMNFTTNEGLPDENIYDIVEDKNGTLWLGTRLGFSGLKFKATKPIEVDVNSDVKFSNEVLKQDYKPVFENYNFKNGYPVRNIANLNAMCVDTN